MNLGYVSTISTEYVSYDVLTISERFYCMAFPDLGRLREIDLRLRYVLRNT
jgi:hypothetical protein